MGQGEERKKAGDNRRSKTLETAHPAKGWQENQVRE